MKYATSSLKRLYNPQRERGRERERESFDILISSPILMLIAYIWVHASRKTKQMHNGSMGTLKIFRGISQLIFTCSKSKLETQEKDVKHFQKVLINY